LGRGDVRLRLENLALHRRDLRGANVRVDEIRARGGERAAGGLDLPPGGRDHGCLRLLAGLGSSCLLLGDQLLLEQTRERLAVPLRLGVGRFGLGQLGFGSGQAALGLADATLGIGARLVHAELVLPELFVQHGDLVLGQAHARLRLADHRLGLLLSRADLLVVEYGDDLPRLDLIALAHAELADPSGRLGGDRRIVTLDASTHRDNAVRHGRWRQYETPDGGSGHAKGQHGDNHERALAHP
jgi:hypothetical protein